MVPKIKLEKARMRSETSRKRTVGSIHSDKKDATKRQKKRQKRRENCLKEVEYTPTPFTPIFTQLRIMYVNHYKNSDLLELKQILTQTFMVN